MKRDGLCDILDHTNMSALINITEIKTAGWFSVHTSHFIPLHFKQSAYEIVYTIFNTQFYISHYLELFILKYSGYKISMNIMT
jgi:hypothetical protein